MVLEEITVLVESFLRNTDSILSLRRVIPPSQYKTHLEVGKDFEGIPIMGLESYKVLEKYIPANFSRLAENTSQPNYWSFPSTYIFNLLTRAIEITNWGEGERLDSPNTVNKVAIELIQTLEGETTCIYKCRSISHLTTQNEQTLYIKGLLVRPYKEDGSMQGPKQWTKELVHGAFTDWRDKTILSIERPLSLVAQKIEGSWQEVDEKYSDNSTDISEFVLACRLIYNATLRNYWEVMGSPDPLSPYKAITYEMKDFDGLISLIRKDAIIAPEHIAGIEWLWDEIHSALNKTELQSASPIEIGLSNFTRSHLSGKSIRAIADLATCLESIMTPRTTNEIGLKLRSRTAALINTESDSIQELYSDIKNLYELRSTLIHGGFYDDEKLGKILGKIVKRDDISTNEKLALAVYRFQDIVRRALLARLTLDSLPNSPWSEANYPNLDALLADHQFRNECQEKYLNKLIEVGLGFAIEKSKPAQVTFVDSTPELDT